MPYKEYLKNDNWKTVCEEAFRIASVNLESKPAPAGEMKVVLGPGNAAIYQNELIIVIFALPFAAISLIYSTSLRGFDFPLKAQIIESLLHTGLVLIFSFFSLLFLIA